MKYKIIVDKQSRTNPSEEKREYEIDIEELRCKGDVYDSLVITKDEDYVIRRLSLSDLHVLKVLDEPVKEPLADINIELFEGDNYIYLVDMTGNKFYAEYLVKNDFTDLYVTTNQMNTAINQSASQIELTVNQKLEGYSDTTEMNSAITQKANEITSTVSETYATKTELSTAKTEIKQTTDSISSTVSKKVGNDEIISKINQSAEMVGINANKIELSAEDILNLIAGNTINLTSKNIVIASDNFNVDKNGSMSCSNVNITGGKINLVPTSALDVLRVIKNNNPSTMTYISDDVVGINNGSNHVEIACQETPSIDLYIEGDTSNCTYIKHTGITTPKLTQTSLESIKKNIEEAKINALETISNSDIYTYNLKSEKDGTKKHFGFVIGNKYKTPSEVMSEDKQGIDTYSMSSIMWKAMQELIEQLQERDKQKDNQIAELTKRLERLEATNGKN